MSDNNTVFNKARLNAENKIYAMMDLLDGKKDGYNSTKMRKYFQTLNDKQFKKFMERLANEEWFNLDFEAGLDIKRSGNDIELEKIKDVAKKLDVELFEYVAYPFKNPFDLENPPISVNKVPVIYVTIRPLQQLLDKKQAYSSDNDHVNQLTGQVTSTSKSSTLSNMQVSGLQTSNQTEVVKEMLGPRSDDEVSKAKMIRQIEETGKFDLNSIPIRTKDKQSIETSRVMLVAAGLRVAFGNEKLSYILPTD